LGDFIPVDNEDGAKVCWIFYARGIFWEAALTAEGLISRMLAAS
jgi:hypothetical protein